MLNKIFLLFVSLFVLVAGAPVNVAAQEPTQSDDWQFAIGLYFWGSSIGGKSASGSPIDIELDDILDSLEFAFMGAAGVRKGKWLLAADVMYLDVENSADIAPGVTAKAELTNWIVTPVVGYNIIDAERGNLDILGGARYLYMKADLRVDALGARVKDSGSNWDAVIGARGALNFAKNWHLLG